MINNNQPDWNDLQNEQAETNATQIDKIWAKAKSLPIYFWTMLFVMSMTLAYTLRLNYVIKPQIETEQKQNDQLRNDLKDARAIIKGKDQTIENCLASHSDENIEVSILRNNLRHKTIGKQFYHAVANELAGRPDEKINYHLDKMFSDNHERASLIKESWVKDALDFGAIIVAERVGRRVEIARDREKFEAIATIKKLIKNKSNVVRNIDSHALGE